MLHCWNGRHNHATNAFPIKIWICKDNDSMQFMQALNAFYILVIYCGTSCFVGLYVKVTFEIGRIIATFDHDDLGNFYSIYHYRTPF